MKISKLLGINKSQHELDFFDFIVDRDTYKFFDPYYFSKSNDPFLQDCHNYVTTFFNRFLYLLENGFERESIELFSHLGEVNEICLGMSKGMPSGKGIGSTDARKIFAEITKSAAFETGVITSIEDLRLYIQGIDKDKISDMIANIIKKPLIDYTKKQCKLHGIELTLYETGFYWDKTGWERSNEEMLVVNGKSLLLYPKNLITKAKYFSAEEFFKKYILEYLKEKHINEDSPLVRKKTDKNGKIISVRVCKKDIIEDIEKRDGAINKDWIARFAKENTEVYKKLRADTINRIVCDKEETLPQEDIVGVIDILITELKNINKGTESATKYHHLMSGVLELLFFPALVHPTLENNIHDGRKRIDITFDNAADKGFFFLLGTSYNIPCSIIMIECKNYSKDIANPELDQMAGRFSARRGKFGIICCRDIDSSELFVKREQDTLKDDRGLIIHLTDSEIIYLLEQRKIGITADDYLVKKYSEVII